VIRAARWRALVRARASGGRRIMPAVAQVAVVLVDYGMTLEEAFHQPRLDVRARTVPFSMFECRPTWSVPWPCSCR
jgi:gamma-glutamyltranspeptidase